MKKVLLLTILMAGSLFGEKLVIVKNFNRKHTHLISKKYDIVDLSRDNTLKLLVYDDGQYLRSLGYSFKVVVDYDTVKTKLPPGYHTFSQFVAEFESLVVQYSSICLLDTIGFSSQGRPILAMKISDNPHLEEFEPEVRLVGVHHGNEQISGEVLMAYAPYLLENYGIDPFVTKMVNEREIWIIPIFNPDGYVASTRRNANDVDLNRDYGYMWDGEGSSPRPYSQPETQAMYEFSQLHNFVLSLTFHSGAFYVNYPWNYTPVRCEDNPFIYDVSVRYGDSTGYPVTEGYDWYQTRGDLNDYSYGIDSDIDITIEVWGTGYNPPASLIDSVALLNRGAINMILLKAGQGIGGFVIDSTTGDTIKEARIYVEGIRWPAYTDRITGDFVKPLLPGTYTLRVEANGYQPKTISNVTVYEDSLTTINVYLTPGGGKFAFKPVEVFVNASNYSRITVDTFLVGNMLGENDGNFYYLGIGGYVVLDLGLLGVANGYLKVYEGDDGNPDEGYTVYGSNNWNGPWNLIGNGSGTQEFTFAGSYRYIKIVDDGDGSESAPNPGFDLDAVQSARPSGPYVDVINFTIDDSQGNGNGVPDPGESVNVIFTLANSGLDTAANFVCVVVPGDSFLNLSVDTISFGNIAPEATITDTITMSVSSTCPRAHQDSLVFNLAYSNFTRTVVRTFDIGVLTAVDPTGPDNYGYYAVENTDTLVEIHPVFSWLEISGIGTPLGLGDDDIRQVNLPFNFTYYGSAYSRISVCSNGFIAMGSSNTTSFSNHSLPYSDGTIMVAPLWDDLNPSSNGEVYYHYDSENHRFIVEWSGVPHYGGSQPYTFEVIFYDPSYHPTPTGDGLILFQYQHVPDAGSATIGIENPSEADALQYWYNGTGGVTVSGPADGRAILFTTTLNVGISEQNPSPEKISFDVYPNTASHRATISFSLFKTSSVSIKIYDISGKLVKTMDMKNAAPGLHSVYWDLKNSRGRKVSSGLYFVKIQAEGVSKVRKIIVVGNKMRR